MQWLTTEEGQTTGEQANPDEPLRGGRYLGLNSWLPAAAPAYLKKHGKPERPAELSAHPALIYSSLQGRFGERWWVKIER